MFVFVPIYLNSFNKSNIYLFVLIRSKCLLREVKQIFRTARGEKSSFSEQQEVATARSRHTENNLVLSGGCG